MRQPAFTFTEALVLSSIVAVMFALLLPAAYYAKRAVAAAAASDPPPSWSLYTVQHDGHHWVLGNRVGFHHPDCPCRTRNSEDAP